MDLWVGPAIIAALVSALVSAAGWFVSSWQVQRLDERRRAEKVHDYQVALRAEVAGDLLVLQVGDRAAMLEALSGTIGQEPNYRPFVPRLARNLVFEQVVREIHVLPGEVIAAVIQYQQLRQSVEHFIDDIRSAQNLDAARRLLMLSDYFGMLGRLEILATNAVASLDRSLLLSKPAADRPSQGSASAPASVEPEVLP